MVYSNDLSPDKEVLKDRIHQTINELNEPIFGMKMFIHIIFFKHEFLS